MHINIRVSGAAGLGINSTAEIIGSVFADLGYQVLTDIEYESRIKGGVNWFDINISDETPRISKMVDIFIVFDGESFLKSFPFLHDASRVFLNKKVFDKLDDSIKEAMKAKNIHCEALEIQDKYDNTYLLAMLCYYLSIPFEYVDANLERVFGKKSPIVYEANKKIIQSVLEKLTFEKAMYSIDKKSTQKSFSYGNKLVCHGAIAGELEYYSAYPMTPASSILTEIIKSKKVTYLQAEDEIAVINSALGASFTAKRSAVGTSGGGFALMTEALSFAIQAEFPITVFLSMRAGPSTGTPTFFEQGDFNFALNPTFGDFEHIVLYPSSLEECYTFSQYALNFADTYQTVVIMLLDKQLSEIHGTYTLPENLQIQRGEILSSPPEDYKRYELTENGISPRVKVGTPQGDFIATSYEHDEYGATTEDPEMKVLMTQKRWKKLENFYKDQNITGFEVINPDAKKMFVTTSVNAYNLKKFVENYPEYGLVIIKILKPLDERFLDICLNKKEIIFIESNYSGQLENYICKEFGLKYQKGLKISNYRKYDLYPFYYEDLQEKFTQ